jgi:hypothetical protein
MASRSSRGASSSRTGLSVAAVAQLTVPAGVNQAVVQADGGGTIAVRFTLDGTTPTTTPLASRSP